MIIDQNKFVTGCDLGKGLLQPADKGRKNFLALINGNND
jgi:hypothetical protein